MFNITTNGNYTFITNEDTGTSTDRLSSEIEIVKKYDDSTVYSVRYRGNIIDNLVNIPFTEFKLEGVAFTDQTAFENWKNQNTGLSSDPFANNPKGRLNKLFFDAANNFRDITYHVVGDSNRSNDYSRWEEYYTDRLSNLNLSVNFTARSGLQARRFLNNTDAVNINVLKSKIVGDGSNDIVELSLGGNDYNGINTLEQIKGFIEGIVNDLKNEFPNITIISMVPMYTANTARNVFLQELYTNLATDFDLVLVDITDILQPVHGNPVFYNDSSHLNRTGAIRAVNKIMDIIIPAELIHLIRLEEIEQGEEVIPPNLAVVQSGFYNNSGLFRANDAITSLAPIVVQPNFDYRVKHGGDRNDYYAFNEEGALVVKLLSVAVAGQDYSLLSIPINIVEIRANVSTDPNFDRNQEVYFRLDYTPVAAVPDMDVINDGVELRQEKSINDLIKRIEALENI